MNSIIGYEMTFDAGHRIVGHKGKCARLHGHTYRVVFTVAGQVRDPGFVIDFGDLKDVVNEWDHRMLLWEEDPFQIGMGRPPDRDITIEQLLKEVEFSQGIVRLPFNPTAENMAQHLAQKVLDQFHVHWVELELWETPKCSAKVQRALP